MKGTQVSDILDRVYVWGHHLPISTGYVIGQLNESQKKNESQTLISIVLVSQSQNEFILGRYLQYICDIIDILKSHGITLASN